MKKHGERLDPRPPQDDNTNTTTYIYDDKGRVYRVISPDTGTTTYAYDPAGNLISKTDAKGITISYTYDALNRLTLIDFAGDTDTIYTYDTCLNGKGRLCTMADASGTTTYEYSPKGQVKKETKVIDGIQYVTQYTYDQNGNMKTMTYPSGKVITYNYTNDKAVSVLNGAVNLATNIAYKPFGGMSSLTYGNGLAGTIGYDNQYRVTSIAATGVMSLSYPTYDNNGNIQAINDGLDATKNKSFTYDTLDRLWTAATGTRNFAWTYDGVGNRQTENSNSYTYVAGSNKLNTANGLTYGFDNNGNTTAEGARQFVYNQNQRLIRVTDSGVTKGEYTYNGNGQRVKKIAAGITTIYNYSLNGQIIGESNSAGTITAEYVYLNSQPLAKMEGANTYYYHNDHLATPQKMTDASGVVVWAADYKPFGEAAVSPSSTITNNLRFPGQYFDAETNLNQNYYRDYDPIIGKYVEADPIGLYGGINIYTYSANAPTGKYDLRGLCTECDQCPSGKYHYEGVEYGGFFFVIGVKSSTLRITCIGKPSVSFTITMTCAYIGGGLGGSIGTPVGLAFGCNNRAAEDAILGWSWYGAIYPNPFQLPQPGLGLGLSGSGSLTAAGVIPGAGIEASGGGGYCKRRY